ncbi:efflux RND transporter permease subunit [Proteinivorax hydrogeniformans]|uniref:Efflux RND transporter permease subunit n=1 Tax=Proteinivorax hydrogeniformans TaxID=1826727 RepID=A0AAU8HW55_9FIRM
MNLSSLGIKRPIAMLMVVSIILLLGVISFTMIPVDLYPEMDLPVLLVMMDYDGAGPEEVETMLTRPMEEALSTLDGLDEINSISQQGRSIIILDFNWGTDMKFASLEARETVDMVLGHLPGDISSPMVMQLDPDMMPIIQLGMVGDLDYQELTEMANGEVKTRLERIEGVAMVDVAGGEEREISIVVDPYKLDKYGLSVEEVAMSVQASNIDVSGGTIVDGEREYVLQVLGQFNELKDIESVFIGSDKSGTPIALGDVGYIEDKTVVQKPITTINGEETISLGIRKQNDANTVEVASLIHEEIAKLEGELAGDVNFEVVIDQSMFIEEAIDSLIEAGVVGAILAMIVLWIFLGNFRATVIVGVAIPVSVIGTFALIYLRGDSLNFITLGGLALGIGMMVDNAVVILENIFSKREKGIEPTLAAQKGSKEVAGAITASTITSAVAFLPVIFVDGIAGIIFAPLAWTVTFSLFVSLLVAISIMPVLTVKVIPEGMNVNEKNKFSQKVDKALERLKLTYKNLLKTSLSKRKAVVALFVLFMVFSVFLYSFVGFEFLPAMDAGILSITFEFPAGTTFDEMEDEVYRVESYLEEIEEIDLISTEVGSGGAFDLFGGAGGRIDVSLVDLRDRNQSVFEVAEEVRETVPPRPGVDMTVSVMDMSGGVGDDVEIILRGDQLEILEEQTELIGRAIEGVDGIREVETSFDEELPQLSIEIDHKRAQSHGLTSYQVGEFINFAMTGETVTIFREDGYEYQVGMVMDYHHDVDIPNVQNLSIPSPLGYSVPLRELANFEVTTAPRAIQRENEIRAGYVTAQLLDRDLSSAMEEIQEEVDKLDIPDGYILEYGGAYEEMVDAFDGLILALILGIVLVFMVMAAQFESLIYPLIIMFTLPQTFVGIIAALLITNRSLSIIAFIGIIMLAGIVVNNGIVMVDYTNQLYHGKKMERKKALLEAGQSRLRPILMTSLTTILGMLPMAFSVGEGAEVRAPLATVVIGGLAVSTVLTLVLIPVMYSILDDFKIWMAKKASNKNNKATNL